MDYAYDHVTSLMQSETIVKGLEPSHVELATVKSRSGINIWGFSISPIIDELDAVYTCGTHFLHDEFREYDLEITRRPMAANITGSAQHPCALCIVNGGLAPTLMRGCHEPEGFLGSASNVSLMNLVRTSTMDST